MQRIRECGMLSHKWDIASLFPRLRDYCRKEESKIIRDRGIGYIKMVFSAHNRAVAQMN